MKKLSVLFLVAVLALSVTPAYADVCSENGLDKAWDSLTTAGKSGLDKEAILAKNKAKRVEACAKKMAKKAQKEAGKAADDMKKKLGL